jgi:chemotaxis protein histidine kinase CheA
MLRRVAVELEGGQGRLIRASEEQLDRMLALQLQPLRGSLHLLARYARELGRSLGREVEMELEGEETRLDRRITRELEDALLHLVRNAVDHGIEPPEIREVQGKPRVGRLRLRATPDGPRVRISLQDDGGGIDTAKVLQRAVAVGLVDAAGASTMGREEALRLIFAPGFSTRSEVSEVSGRGVGLDVVASAVNRVGGEVFLDTDLGRGTTISLEVPVARRGEAVMLLRVGQLRLALPSSVVRRATRLDPSMIVERDGRTIARFPDRLVPFVPLARLYGQPEDGHQLLLEGAVSGQALAVAVDDVEGEQEILVRPMTRKVAADRLLEGVALLASGEPVGVLAPAVLAQREYLRALPVAREQVIIKKVRVLLVDDSLVTREMERRLLEDAGFHVSAAGDAEEALSQLAELRFDCVVTDIEMPGMDGFELTAQLRGMEHFTHLPIIVVSTRDRPEDRLRGLKVGADAYLTKQSLDAGELVDLVRRLSGT